jgi:small conductance mechanosensitive channel
VEVLKELFADLTMLGLAAVIAVVLSVFVWLVHRWLLKLFAGKSGWQLGRQFIMLGIYLFVLVLAVVLMPLDATVQTWALSFIGVLVGVALVLSSATIVSNTMAGLVVRAQRHFTIGAHIQAGEYSGYVTSMDMLHVVVQTDERGLLSLPYLYLVANPVNVLPITGATLRTDVFLNIRIRRDQAEAALSAAAKEAGLEQVVVRVLGVDETEVQYEVAGVLKDVRQLASATSELNGYVLDVLQASGVAREPAAVVQAASASQDDEQMSFSAEGLAATDAAVEVDEVAAEMAALKKEYTEMSQDLIGIEQELKVAGPGDARKPINLKKKKFEARMLRIEKKIVQLEAARG